MVIWVAGCPFRCKGCIQPDYLSKNSGKDISVQELTNIVNHYLNQIDGITISGGEPLWQADVLSLLMENTPSSLDKMVFTGYKIDELNESQLECLSKFDLVVDGRFKEMHKGDYMWRGSSNQKFHSPTGKYTKKQLEDFYNSKSKGLEITVKDSSIFFYGIPPVEEINEIYDILQSKSINILTP
jgi:anaerobic ribonucleoside-triphosphate reductase activating protein